VIDHDRARDAHGASLDRQRALGDPPDTERLRTAVGVLYALGNIGPNTFVQMTGALDWIEAVTGADR
jgi:hypothetical protein